VTVLLARVDVRIHILNVSAMTAGFSFRSP